METALACPECGVEHPLPPGQRLIKCTSCSTSSVLIGVDATPERMVKPLVDAAQAARAAKRWLRGMRVRELVTARADFSAPKLSFLPFVRVEADVLGWLFGTRRHEGEKGRVYYTDEEIEIAESHDEAMPLADGGENGVHRLESLADVDTVPFDDASASKLGDVVPALTTEQTIEDRARDQWLQKAREGHDLHSVTDEEISLVGVNETVVYYPFWRVTYRYGGGDYYVMVDARTGEIAAGKAPGSFLVSALLFAAMLPVASVILAVGLTLAATICIAGAAAGDVSDTLAGVIICAGIAVGAGAVAIGTMLTTAGHRSMRYGGEVEGGYGVRPDAGLFVDESDGEYRKRRVIERAEVDADPRLSL